MRRHSARRTALIMLVIGFVISVLATKFYIEDSYAEIAEAGLIGTPSVAGLLFAIPFRLLNIHIPDMLYTPVAQFSDATVPLALFVLGGTLRFSSLKKNMNTVTAVFVLKLILVPAAMLAITSCFGFTNMERFVIFTLYSTPMATSVFSMAQGMNADSELAGEIIVVTTVGSVITLFLWIFGMNSFGML